MHALVLCWPNYCICALSWLKSTDAQSSNAAPSILILCPVDLCPYTCFEWAICTLMPIVVVRTQDQTRGSRYKNGACRSINVSGCGHILLAQQLCPRLLSASPPMAGSPSGASKPRPWGSLRLPLLKTPPQKRRNLSQIEENVHRMASSVSPKKRKISSIPAPTITREGTVRVKTRHVNGRSLLFTPVPIVPRC